jgi:hypothetical protein
MEEVMSEVEKLKIVYLKIGDVKPYERNNKKHSQNQVDKLVKIIQAGKFDVPIVVDANNVIIKGHCRLLACKKLKMKEVPCIIRADTSEIQNKTDRIADNKSGELAETDMENLKLEMADLQLEGIDVELTGYDSWDFSGDNTEGNEPVKPDLDNYTKKIKSPVYEPKQEKKPAIKELFDTTKTDKLLAEINLSKLPEAEKNFLRFAAYRHVVFNYENIAEYYSHSEKEAQNLIENSAMVIIDFNKAIENGFVVLSQEIAEAYTNDSDKS